ncbi:hypothetical protein GQX74_011212 [Glossina fuscipes]|nr:hypothetical protein GQX74_011212 [Glossina fuscipes]
MMTASSVEFFPCRVQLMGLPRSTATATASSGDLPTALVQRNTPNITQTTSTVTYRRPPLAKVQGVSRNLFGTPKPGEINQLFQKEAQRQRSYVLQRYNFDIASGKPTTKQQHPTAAVVKANININERYLVTQIPGSLIERELQEHEQRLQKEKWREDNTDNSNNKHVNNNLQTDNTKSNTIDTNNDDNNNDNDNDDGGDDNDDDDNNDDDDDDDDDIDTLTATGGTTIMLQVSVSAQKASRNMTSISTANAPHTHHA